MSFIDTREHELIKILPPEYERKQLPVGDIWIGADFTKPGIIIERKTIRDLESSVIDGRYSEQKTRLLTHCQQTGARSIYIIEGPYSFTSGKLDVPALMKLILHLQSRYGVTVMHTISLQETATLVKAIADDWNANKDAVNIPLQPTICHDRAITPVPSINKKENAGNPINFAVACMSQCPGISTKMAGRIVSQFKNLEEIMSAEESIFASISGDTKKIGPAVGKRLYALLHSSFSQSCHK